MTSVDHLFSFSFIFFSLLFDLFGHYTSENFNKEEKKYLFLISQKNLIRTMQFMDNAVHVQWTSNTIYEKLTARTVYELSDSR